MSIDCDVTDEPPSPSLSLPFFLYPISLRNSNTTTSTTLIALRGNNLIIIRPHLQSQVSPSIEMIRRRDFASHTFTRANRPILLKGRGTNNGRLVGTGSCVNVVGAAVRGHFASIGELGFGVVCAVGFEDVVLLAVRRGRERGRGWLIG